MVILSNFPDFFSSSLTFFLVSTLLIFNITYGVIFSSSQQLAFPAVNRLNLQNFMFLILTLIFFTVFLGLFDFNKQCFGNYSFYNSVFELILLLSTFCFLFVTDDYVKAKKVTNFEYSLLLNFALMGLLLINSCDNLLTFYLAIELQSLCFYVLACLDKNSSHCAEASLKYFILGAFSSGLLLFGFVTLYMGFGSINFESVERIECISALLIISCGTFFVSVALLFKLGAFPFHMWLCDVYDGSMVNVTAFFATVPKLILFSFLLKFDYEVISSKKELLNFLLLSSALGSVVFASVVALYQKRFKRLLAYSTISHTGFILFSISCVTIESIKTSVIYLTIYISMSLGLFAILCISAINNNSQKYILNWSSFFDRNFAMAFSLAVIMFSTAGIPPLSGFYSKLCVLITLISNNHVVITVIIAIFSSIACFYYIRVIKILFFGSKRKNGIWTGLGTKSTELYISLITFIIMSFLSKPGLLIDSAVLTGISLS